MQELKEFFERVYGEPPKHGAPLRADGSARKLYRLTGRRGTVIGVSNADASENRAFIGFSRQLRKAGLPVPEIYAEDLDRGLYLEQDLGDTTLFQHLSARRKGQEPDKSTVALYRKVVEWLPRFQIQGGRAIDYKLCYPRRAFDKRSMLWDLNYFKYYFLRLSKTPFDEQALEDDFDRFSDFLLDAPSDFFLYRDFQSRNVMALDGKPYFIDYQGGRKGALQYDIASLLFDAKADLPFDLRQELLERYLDHASKLTKLDRKKFLKYYPGFVYIRIMQAMGAYGLRGFYEGKTHFLQSIPYAVRNLEYLLRASVLPVDVPDLLDVFRRLVVSSQLRQYGATSLTLTVRIKSFSYKSGIPIDDTGHGGGFIFDCRALPNPGRQQRFAELTGKDRPVIAYLEKERSVKKFLGNVSALVDQTVDNYRSRNFTDLMVAFGCTGGRHRSVYCAERLAAHLKKKFAVEVEVSHREQAA